MFQLCDRTEYSIEFRAINRKSDLGLRPHWITKKGNPILIFPPSCGETSWFIYLAYTGEYLEFRGDDAEGRAFCAAEGLSRS